MIKNLPLPIPPTIISGETLSSMYLYTIKSKEEILMMPKF